MITSSVTMIAAILICFIAAMLNLAVESRVRMRMTRAALVTAALLGAFFYGYGYAWCEGLHVYSLIKALLALCRMFGGANDLGAVQAAPLFRYPVAISVFWLAHYLAFYVTASATIAALGERLLRRIRVMRLRKGPLLLIYGVNPHSVTYGRRMARDKGRSVVLVDPDDSSSYESAVKAFGGVLEKDDDALAASPRFLRQLNVKPGKRKLELAALHTDGRRNLEYAMKLQASMKARGIRPEQASLLAAGLGDEAAALQALSGEGYGNVYAFDNHDLIARMIVRDHPPCDQIRFDETGRAAEDFHAVIVGFGRMGRAVLNSLTANGQFAGSRFRADIFDPAAQNGFLHNHPMMRQYDIRFHAVDGRSDGFYSFLEENRKQIRMIVLCTGDRGKNREIAEDLAGWFPRDEKMPTTVYATQESCFRLDENRCEASSPHFFDRDGLDLEQMDDMAMQVNQIYCEEAGSTQSAEENWRQCSYMSRQSNRACADFYPAVLRASGKTEEQVLAGEWPPAEEVLENLSVTEHLRWCALQYTMGYSAMSGKVWDRRAKQYQEEKASGKTPGWRISKDDEKKLQACLIPWDDLDELSRRENAVTGGHVDYKKLDRNNVLQIARVLSARRKENGHG